MFDSRDAKKQAVASERPITCYKEISKPRRVYDCKFLGVNCFKWPIKEVGLSFLENFQKYRNKNALVTCWTILDKHFFWALTKSHDFFLEKLKSVILAPDAHFGQKAQHFDQYGLAWYKAKRYRVKGLFDAEGVDQIIAPLRTSYLCFYAQRQTFGCKVLATWLGGRLHASKRTIDSWILPWELNGCSIVLVGNFKHLKYCCR